MTIGIGSDHAGFELKENIKRFLMEKGFSVTDYGTDSPDVSVDYPDIARLVCDNVLSGDCAFGVLCCGTGIGMSIAANRLGGIRAANCNDIFSAKMARAHNDANVLSLGSRILAAGLACEILSVFLETKFEGGRHQTRVDKLQ